MLADALLNVRERAVVSDRWIETNLSEALDRHDWRNGRPGNLPKLAKQVAKLVYGGPDQREPMARKLAALTRQSRVRDAVRRFFNDTGLEVHGVPVDHPTIGREQLMAAMLGRFIYEREPGYHQDELAHQGVYVLLQRAGDGQVNRSLFIIDSLGAQNVMWAAHLYRPANIPDARLNMRTGVFLPYEARTALMSGARWISAEPMIRKHLTKSDADAFMTSVSDGSEGEDFEARELAILTLKPHGAAVMRIKDAGNEYGYVKLKNPVNPDAFTALGLKNRDALSAEEAAVIPRNNANHAQAYADVQDALARFAAIAGASGLDAPAAAPAGTGESELAAAPADVPVTEAPAIEDDPSTDNPSPAEEPADGDPKPAQIS
ncbi:MAG: hypothetical protein LAT81_05535 [Oceanicaulis sp.]|nr:hypothetical protein [Oceanicaulis sp.]